MTILVAVLVLFAAALAVQDLVEVTTLRRRAQARHQKARAQRVSTNTNTNSHDGLLDQAAGYVQEAAARKAAESAADRLIARGEELAAKATAVPTPMWEVEQQDG